MTGFDFCDPTAITGEELQDQLVRHDQHDLPRSWFSLPHRSRPNPPDLHRANSCCCKPCSTFFRSPVFFLACDECAYAHRSKLFFFIGLGYSKPTSLSAPPGRSPAATKKELQKKSNRFQSSPPGSETCSAGKAARNSLCFFCWCHRHAAGLPPNSNHPARDAS